MEAIQHGELVLNRNREARKSVGEILKDIEEVDALGQSAKHLSENSLDHEIGLQPASQKENQRVTLKTAPPNVPPQFQRSPEERPNASVMPA